MTEKREQFDTIIIGAGAAGLMAAGSLCGARVAVLERNEKAGKKLYITGKGRCNVTHDCAPAEFLQSVLRGQKFLYSAVYGFTPDDTKAMLCACGVPVKTERGARVFPASDKSSDVIRALSKRAERAGARFYYDTRVTCVDKEDERFIVRTERETFICKHVLVATGGKSYPATGSTGDGYAVAARFGHTVTPQRPSLVSLSTRENVAPLSGLTLKNVAVRLIADGKTYTEFGELLFTHEGVSGPTVLRLSAYAAYANLPMLLYIDCKPALDEEKTDKRLCGDFAENTNRRLKNAMDKLLPRSLIPYAIAASGVSPEKAVNGITAAERRALGQALKNLPFTVTGRGALSSAVVTAGGVSTREINPKTMESKLVKNLYFAGEVLDIDALTGGFNIQIAFSTAYAAAKAISSDI